MLLSFWKLSQSLEHVHPRLPLPCTPLCPWALTSWGKADVRGRNGWIVGWFQGSITGIWQHGRALMWDGVDQRMWREQWKCFREAAPPSPYCIPDQEGLRGRGICIAFLLFAFLGTYSSVWVCWKEVFLFVSLKRRFNHSYSKHTSYGPRPWSILFLVSFQKDAVMRVRRLWA